LAAAEDLLARAAAATDAAALRAVESDAATALATRGPRPQGRAQAPRVPYRTFRSASGARILVGRSARDNDELTLRVARGNDVWLHARGVQGSHVVVPDAGDAPDARALGDAALLAAHFSRARGEDAAEISWTRRKHVRKPKGAAAGSVIATQERTLRVRLDGARLAALLSSEE
jgi:predicted ribosome quality control (RQC) complex YloA/Tae2 family protein